VLSELFAAIPEIKEGGFTRIVNIPGVRDLIQKLTDFDIRNIPASVGKLIPKLMKMTIDQLPPLPALSGGRKKSDQKDWMKTFLSMLESIDFSDLPVSPLPLMPIMPPLPVMPLPLPMPGWGWFGGKNSRKRDSKDQLEDLKTDAETYREQMRSAQKMSMDAFRNQWDKAFPKYMEMQETLASFLPDDAPVLPGLPSFGVSPRAFMEKINEFQREAGRQAMEQADSFFDFFQQEQRRTSEAISKTVKNIEGEANKTSEDAEQDDKA
jgi:hypothetical protein